MARTRKMTEEERAAFAAKRRATMERKKREALGDMGVSERPTVTKRASRAPMTPEQRKAATKRLEKAREAKASKDNSELVSYDEHVRNLPDLHPLSLMNVKAWIKKTKEELHAMRGMKNSKIAKEREEFLQKETYLHNLNFYARNGVWVDERYGADQEHPIKKTCIALAYNADGTPKRTDGVFYSDIGMVWGAQSDE